MAFSVLVSKHGRQIFVIFIYSVALDELEKSVCVDFWSNKWEVSAHKLECLGIGFGELRNSVKKQYKNRIYFVLVLTVNCIYTLVLALHEVDGLRKYSLFYWLWISRFGFLFWLNNKCLFLEIVQVERPLLVNECFKPFEAPVVRIANQLHKRRYYRRPTVALLTVHENVRFSRDEIACYFLWIFNAEFYPV